MAKIKGTEIRPGMVLKVDGDLFVVIKMDHVTPGKGRAHIQTKLKSVSKGTTFEKRFSSSDKIESAFVDIRAAEYLYADAMHAVFMDIETYDNIEISLDMAKDALPYMPDNAEAKIKFIDGTPILVDLPASVELKVQTAPPSVKGDTATNVTKVVTTETGLEVRTPAHIKVGDTIKVDTRTGEFIERVNK